MGIKRFFQEMNKKLVERYPLSSIPPFNKVKGDGRNHIGAKSLEDELYTAKEVLEILNRVTYEYSRQIKAYEESMIDITGEQVLCVPTKSSIRLLQDCIISALENPPVNK